MPTDPGEPNETNRAAETIRAAEAAEAAEVNARMVSLFAEESRVRAFAAVALGARSAEQVAAAAELSPREAAAALRRLREQGVVVAGDAGALTVAYGLFKERARAAARRERTAAGAGTGDTRTDMVLRTFVQDGRLVRLPARWTRKKLDE